MNLSSTARRQDQPLRIGAQHGYRIDGDLAFINADVSVPPYHSGGGWTLELWASEQPQSGSELLGTKISEVHFDLATPIAPHTHRVEAQVPARLPLQGRPYAMSIALVEARDDGERSLHDIANYPECETFLAPHLDGDVGYAVQEHEVVLDVGGVVSPRAADNESGSLSLELWALPLGEVADAVADAGHCLAVAQLGSVSGQRYLPAFQARVAFAEPPAGRWQLALLLREWTRAFGPVTRDRRDFSLPYERSLPEEPAPRAVEAAPSAVTAPVAVAAPVAVTASVAVQPAAVAAPEKPRAVEVAPIAVKPAVAPVAVKPAVVQPAAAPVAVKPAVAPVAMVAPEKPRAVEAAPVAVQPVAVAVPVAVQPAVVATPEKPRVVPTPSVAVAQAPTSAASLPTNVVSLKPATTESAPLQPRSARVVSIQTASVEDLAKVKGLNLRIAKEIVKARPYSSVDDLLKLQGIGRKTFDRIRALITL